MLSSNNDVGDNYAYKNAKRELRKILEEVDLEENGKIRNITILSLQAI